MSHIIEIGVELEGGWREEFEDITILGDGSVRKPSGIDSETGHWGEIPSPVLTTSTILPWLAAHYPDGVGPSCGFHIHISLSKGDYQQLISMKFYHFFLKKWEEWGEVNRRDLPDTFFRRLAGQPASASSSAYADRVWIPFQQLYVKGKGDARRCHLNYCYGLHKTIECRLLPMFEDKEIGLRALSYYINMVEEYLDAHPFDKDKPIVETRVVIGGRG